MLYIPQISTFDCGLTCVKIMLANLYKDERYLYLPIDENKKLVSFADMIFYGKKYGLTLKGMTAVSKDNIESVGKMMIASFKNHERNFHAVLVYKIFLGKVYFIDPERGNASLSKKDFLNLWDGNLLIIDELKKKTLNYDDDLLKDKSSILPNIVSLISSVLLIIGIFFVNTGKNVLLPILFFLLYFLFEFLHKIILYKKLESIDQKVISREFDKNEGKEIFQRLEKYKKTKLSFSGNLISVLVASVFIMTIAIMGNITNLILLIVPFLICLFDFAIFKPFKDKRMTEIKSKEHLLLQNEGVYNFEDHLTEIHRKSYDLSKIILLKRYLNIFILIGASLLTLSVSSSTFNLANVVFNFFMELVLYDNLTKLTNFQEEKNIFLKAKVSLINLFHQNDEII